MERIPTPTVQYTKLFYDGQFQNGHQPSSTFDSINPFTGNVIATVHQSTAEDVDNVVKVATNAFELWKKSSVSTRANLLHQLANLIEQNRIKIASLDTLENGIPINESLHSVQAAVQIFHFYAGMVDKIKGHTIPTDGNNLLTITIKEAIGVCAIIIPWNSPTLMLAKTVAPALAAGNTVVVKPAEQTSLSALFIGHLSTIIPFPPGVYNVVPGGGQVGAILAKHMDVNKITFTGSTEVGRTILQSSALSNLKRVTLELGGKNPLVIFDDVDVEKAAQLAFSSLFVSNGQICCCGSRTYVQEKIHDQFVEQCVKLAKKRTLGDPFAKQTEQGPQVDKQSVEKIMKLIKSGINEGARLLVGGRQRISDTCLLGVDGSETLFIEPTVFSDVTESMQIGRKEIFGPVQSIMKFRTMDEIVTRANDTCFGLAAGVLTHDLKRALHFARSVRAGTVWINCYFVVRPQTPFGGYKLSGIGREFGESAIEEYVENKTITINMNNEFMFG